MEEEVSTRERNAQYEELEACLRETLSCRGDGYIRFAVCPWWRGLFKSMFFCDIFFHRKNGVLEPSD